MADDRTVVTLKDRKLVFTVAGQNNPDTTEASSLGSVEMKAGQVVLALSNGAKESYTGGTIKVDPRVDSVRVRHFAGAEGPRFDKQYNR